MRWLLSLIATGALAQNWVEITPKPDLGGWSRGVLPPSTTLPRADLSPVSPWSVKDGVVYAAASKSGHEWLRFDKELDNFELSLEWRFRKVDGSPRYNSGVFLRTTKYGDIWHQAQIGPPGNAGFLFQVTLEHGLLKRTSFKDQQKTVLVRPAGEWNRYEIRVTDCLFEIRVNGEPSTATQDCVLKRGYIGLEAEGFDLEFRNLRLRELP